MCHLRFYRKRRAVDNCLPSLTRKNLLIPSEQIKTGTFRVYSLRSLCLSLCVSTYFSLLALLWKQFLLCIGKTPDQRWIALWKCEQAHSCTHPFVLNGGHRPMEVTSKKPVGRLREVIQAPKKVCCVHILHESCHPFTSAFQVIALVCHSRSKTSLGELQVLLFFWAKWNCICWGWVGCTMQDIRDPRFESLCGNFEEARYRSLSFFKIFHCSFFMLWLSSESWYIHWNCNLFRAILEVLHFCYLLFCKR